MKNHKYTIQIFFSFLIIAAFVVWISVFNTQQADSSNKLKLFFLDVGQGDSEYIKMSNGQDVLIDGGPDDKVLSELGKVMNLGDRKIDLMILTHPHADHISGLIDVLDRYEVAEIWSSGVEYPSGAYDTFKEKIKTKNINSKFVTAGENKNFNETKIKVLYPLTSLENKKIDNLNNSSVIIGLDDDNFKVLFLGDAEENSQKLIISSLKKTTVVKVSHHGSNNGLFEDLYKITRPAIAIISVGAKNTFNHPSKETIDLLKKYLVLIYRTDQNGTIEIDWDGENYKVKTKQNIF